MIFHILIIICLVLTVLFSINAGINFIKMSKTEKVVSILIPALLGFLALPVTIKLYKKYVPVYQYT